MVTSSSHLKTVASNEPTLVVMIDSFGFVGILELKKKCTNSSSMSYSTLNVDFRKMEEPAFNIGSPQHYC